MHQRKCLMVNKKVPLADDLEEAARAGPFAYHIVSHDKSFPSMDYTSRLINRLWDPKFSVREPRLRPL